jgi:transposase-like protein
MTDRHDATSTWLTTGSRCPRCRSADIRAGTPESGSGQCESWICGTCRATFFRLVE